MTPVVYFGGKAAGLSSKNNLFAPLAQRNFLKSFRNKCFLKMINQNVPISFFDWGVFFRLKKHLLSPDVKGEHACRGHGLKI